MGSIRIVRLNTGEELIASVEDDNAKAWQENNDTNVNVDKPSILIPRKNEQGQTALTLVPWVPYIEKEDGVNLNGKGVMYIETPNIDLVNVYNQQFGSGLVIPPNAGKKKKIITGPTLA